MLSEHKHFYIFPFSCKLFYLETVTPCLHGLPCVWMCVCSGWSTVAKHETKISATANYRERLGVCAVFRAEQWSSCVVDHLCDLMSVCAAERERVRLVGRCSRSYCEPHLWLRRVRTGHSWITTAGYLFSSTENKSDVVVAGTGRAVGQLYFLQE